MPNDDAKADPDITVMADELDPADVAVITEGLGKHTFFRCCRVVADHNSYHIGELAIGRQVAGLWPKGRRIREEIDGRSAH
jgi:hypothetical protein